MLFPGTAASKRASHVRRKGGHLPRPYKALSTIQEFKYSEACRQVLLTPCQPICGDGLRVGDEDSSCVSATSVDFSSGEFRLVQRIWARFSFVTQSFSLGESCAPKVL